jgi:hypothetical protein
MPPPALTSWLGHLREMIVEILTFALDSLYSSDPEHSAKALSVIGVLAKYGRSGVLSPILTVTDPLSAMFEPILHEIRAIYSFTQHFLTNISLEQTKLLVDKMELYGVLKTL